MHCLTRHSIFGFHPLAAFADHGAGEAVSSPAVRYRRADQLIRVAPLA